MCFGPSLRTGSGDLITGGDSAGEVFSEYIPLGAYNLVNSLIFPSAREVHTLLNIGDVGQQLESSSSSRLLALEATEPAEEAIKRSIMSNKLNNKLGKLPYALPSVVGESSPRELCARRMDLSDDS